MQSNEETNAASKSKDNGTTLPDIPLVYSIHELVVQFGKKVGLPDMKLDDRGLSRIVLDDNINIDFELSADKERLYIYSDLPYIDLENKEKLMAALLKANYDLHRRSNSRFAFDEKLDKFLLLCVIPEKGLTFEALHEELQTFARTATTFHKNCLLGQFAPGISQGIPFAESLPTGSVIRRGRGPVFTADIQLWQDWKSGSVIVPVRAVPGRLNSKQRAAVYLTMPSFLTNGIVIYSRYS